MKTSLSVLLALASAVTSAFAQDVRAGEHKVAMCTGCHGIPAYQASFPEIHKVPMISGQSAKYIVASLEAYKKGERKHPSMRAIAQSMSEADMADVAAYYERHGRTDTVLPVKAATPSAAVAPLLAKGACAACHGENYNKPIDGSYPKIAGQHADYLYVALKAYKTEGNLYVGRANPVMTAQVSQFTLAELKAMSQYLASLPGELKTVSQSRFR